MLPLLRPKLHDGWMSVSFSPGVVDLAHVLRREGQKPEVLLLDSTPLAIEDTGVAVALRAWGKSHRLASYRSSMLLRPGEYQLLQVEPPEVPAVELKEALRWRIKDMLNYPADAATLDVLEIPLDPGAVGRARQVFVAAAHNALLMARVALFEEARVPLAAIDLPELAQRNISALFEVENRGLALLAIDDTGGLLTFTYQGELYALRHSDVTLTQLEQAGNERREQLLERIALEAQRSLDNFDRLYGHISVPRLLVAPLPGVPEFLEHLHRDISLPVEELDLARVLDFPSLPELSEARVQSRYLKALGAALRD